METAILTSKGQLLIPKWLRTKYGIKSGAKVAFVETSQGLVLKPMDEHYFENLAGMLKEVLPSTADLMKMKQKEKKLSMSYADAFAAAITISKKATLTTGDHEFDALVGETNFKVKYL